MRMFTKFNARTDFNDSADGFYTVLRDTFDTLAKEEALACDWEGLDPIDYPSFGHANDDYEEVVRPFYAVWNGFATKKTFSWKDVYRYSDAPDRRVRRAMEKENKQFREEGIREFNETVRSLIQFVRKRDPRYVPNTQTEAERQKIIRVAATAQAARARAANRAKAAKEDAIPAWTRNDDPIEEEVSEEEEDEAPEGQLLECVVCRKIFKSEKQFEAHERSKKHTKAVQQLQRSMRKEDQALNLDQERSEENVAENSKVQSDDSLEDPDPDEAPHFSGSEESDHADNAGALSDHVEIAPEDEPKAPPADVGESHPDNNVSSSSSTDDDYTSREKVAQRILGDAQDADTGVSTPQSAIDDLSQKLATGSLDDSETPSSDQPKLGKAKAKRAKKAAQQNVSPSAEEYKCAACNAGFPSKTRLFNHIKDFGHAQPVQKAAKGGKRNKRYL